MKIKKPAVQRISGGVGLANNLPLAGVENLRYPIFCFRNLHHDYNIESCIASTDKNHVKSLLKKLKQLSDLSWNDLKLSALGPEKIDLHSINVSLPPRTPKDLSFLFSFYFSGDDARLIGHKNGDIFHIYYIDTNLSVYRH